MKLHWKTLVRTIAILAAATSIAQAQKKKVFVKLETADEASFVEGDSEEPNYPKWIRAIAFGQGLGTSPTTEALPEEFTVVKKTDRSSPILAEAMDAATVFPKVIVVYTRSFANQPDRAPVQIELQDVTITGMHVSFGGLDRVVENPDPAEPPTEEVTFSFSGVRWVYTEFDEAGSSVDVVDGGFGSLLTDPAEDTDGDGVPNAEDEDDDADGIPDDFEITFGLDPLANDASGDSDGDGQSNLSEFVAGTFPNDALSFFQIGSIEKSIESGKGRLAFQVIPSREYVIYSSVDGRDWTEVQKVTVPPDANTDIMEVEFSTSRARTELLRVEVNLATP